jgi:excinuclease UvrABC ATPase subunit
VHGARLNNLKDVSVELPKRRLTVLAGVSGSGKSSLVIGTIAAESQRGRPRNACQAAHLMAARVALERRLGFQPKSV